MPKEYQELIKDVEEIEKSATKVESNTIDISVLSSTQTEHQKSKFSELLESAMGIETQLMKEADAAKLEQQHPQSAKPSPAKTTTKVQQFTAITVRNLNKPMPAAEIKNEIGAFADSLKVEKPLSAPKKFNISAESAKDLILVKLSIPDQINELEHIMEGLREQVFDKDHIEIIKKEAYGLNQEAEKQKIGTDPTEPLSMDQRMSLVRNQRLDEVLAMLRDMNV